MINSENKVNSKNITYIDTLSFQIEETKIDIQKIDNFSWEIYSMVITILQIFNKFDSLQFFLKILLFADIWREFVLDILFLTFNNADI